MLALLESELNRNYHEVWEAASFDDGRGYIELTSYGEGLCSLVGAPLLSHFLPWVDVFAMPEDEVDRLLWLICSVSLPPPPPPAQLTLL